MGAACADITLIKAHSRYFRNIWGITGQKKPYSREKRWLKRYSNSSK